MTRGRRGRLVAVVAATAVAATVAASFPGPPAGAVGDGGASSRVTRDGRIITTILFPSSGGRGRPVGTAITWLTLTDSELAFVFQVAAAHPELADTPLLRSLEPWFATGLSPDLDVQLQLRGGVPTSVVRVVPAPPEPARALARQMVTILPVLPVRVSPPAGVSVPVGQPVFFSFDPALFATAVDETLTAGSVTARVRARPVGFLVRGGDPAEVGRVVRCDGPGRAYDPAAAAGPARQARADGACTVTYRSVTGVGGRRDAWYGDVTVLWRAEWTLDGSTWASLGEIPRLTLFRRTVRPAQTAVERSGTP